MRDSTTLLTAMCVIVNGRWDAGRTSKWGISGFLGIGSIVLKLVSVSVLQNLCRFVDISLDWISSQCATVVTLGIGKHQFGDFSSLKLSKKQPFWLVEASSYWSEMVVCQTLTKAASIRKFWCHWKIYLSCLKFMYFLEDFGSYKCGCGFALIEFSPLFGTISC